MTGTLVRLVCWRCAMRYAHVVDPACSICAGAGVVAAPVPDGVEPIVAARAGSMGPRVMADSPEAVGMADVPSDYGQRSRTGREAGRLLRELGLRKAKPRKPPPSKEERARRAAEKKAHHEAQKQMWESINRRAAEAANEKRRRKVATLAAQALADAHPEEFAEELQTQEVFVALDEGFGPYVPPAVRRVLERQ